VKFGIGVSRGFCFFWVKNWNLERFGPGQKKIFWGDYALGFMHFRFEIAYAVGI